MPRTKWGFVGLRNNVGEYVAESLPNINGSVNSITQGNESLPTSNGALKITDNGTAWQTGSTKYMKKAILTIDASLSSSSYKNNAPVQQRATQMYLYFYVGNFTREAIEETAGLNSELFNNKADRDLSNVPTSINFMTEAGGNYTKWRNGFTILKGSKNFDAISSSSGINVVINLPTPMTGVYMVNITLTFIGTYFANLAYSVVSKTETTFTVRIYNNNTNGSSAAGSLNWIAVGY